MNSNRVCVTGGSGFVGSHLARELVRRGKEVVVLDTCASCPAVLRDLQSDPRLTLVCGSTEDQENVDVATSGCGTIYHLASIVGVRRVIDQALETITVNLRGTINILNVARRTGAKVVLASSADVYGILNKVPLCEDDCNLYAAPTVRRWVYARVKSLEEGLCLEYHSRFGVPTVVVRYFNSYGPGMDSDEPRRVLPLFIDRILKHQDLYIVGSGNQTRSFCFISDMVEGTILAAEVETAEGKVFNIGNDQESSILDLARLVLHTARRMNMADGLTWRFTSVKDFYGEDFVDIARRVPDLTRARQILGYHPTVDLATGVYLTLDYYRSLVTAGSAP